MKAFKKVLACTLAAALALSAATVSSAAGSPTTSVEPVKQKDVKVSQGKVDTKKNGTATLTQVKKTKAKTVTISSTVKVDGVKYKVTTIDANAFAKAPKATKVELPKTITTIKKNAFKGAKKLKIITFKNTKAAKVQKGAFKGLKTRKMTIRLSKKMSSSQKKKMIKNLRKAGFKGKIK